MKRHTLAALALAVVMLLNLMLGSISLAESISENGFTYELQADGTLMLTGCAVNGDRVTIPAQVNGRSVSAISANAFAGCTAMETVTIPVDVVTIEGNPFAGCTALKEILVDDANGDYADLDGVLYARTDKALIAYPAARGNIVYSVPEGIRSLGAEAMAGNHLTAVVLPETMISIGDGAFRDSAALCSVTIPAGVKAIGTDCFSGCNDDLTLVVEDGSIAAVYAGEGGMRTERSVSAQALDEVGAPSGNTAPEAVMTPAPTPAPAEELSEDEDFEDDEGFSEELSEDEDFEDDEGFSEELSEDVDLEDDEDLSENEDLEDDEGYSEELTDDEEPEAFAPVETPAPAPAVKAEPTPVPTAEPPLTVTGSAAAQPGAVLRESAIYMNTKLVSNYNRPQNAILNMHGGHDYTVKPGGSEYGVLTYRGNAFRTNAAVGTVGENTSRLTLRWTANAGSIKGSQKTYYGVEFTGQPAIIKWPKEVREHTNIVDEKRNTPALKEVIVAGADGHIYYLDLADGKPTRPDVNVGYPLYGTPSIHAEGYPLMTVGQYTRKIKTKTPSIGLRFYNLLNQEQIYLIDGLDGKVSRAYSDVGSFNTSALVDRTSDTLVTASSNGLLYVTKLNTEFDYELGSIGIDPSTVVMRSKAEKQKNANTGVDSSMAMYGSYVFYADLGGYLHCVDTNTMENVWIAKLGDKVEAAVSLDFDANGTLWVYVANEYALRSKNGGPCNISRYNAATGELGWTVSINVKKSDKKDKNPVVPGVRASAVIGEHDISDLVIYTVSGLGKEPGIAIIGSENGTAPGCVVALRKTDGSVAWTQALDSHAYSSPVAVYSESGRSWIVQAAASGTVYLLDGKTGTVVNTLQVNGTVNASPAVYGDTLVIGTTGTDTGYIYGIGLE